MAGVCRSLLPPFASAAGVNHSHTVKLQTHSSHSECDHDIAVDFIALRGVQRWNRGECKYKVKSYASAERGSLIDKCCSRDIIHWHINEGGRKESQRGWTNQMQKEMQPRMAREEL